MIRRCRVERVDTCHAFEIRCILLQHAGEITVVVPVMYHLNDDCTFYAVDFHQLKKFFRRGIVRGNISSGRKRKLWIVFPYVHMGVENVIVRTLRHLFRHEGGGHIFQEGSAAMYHFLEINRLQFVDDIGAAALVTDCWATPRDIQIHTVPALITNILQYTMTTREIDVAVP